MGEKKGAPIGGGGDRKALQGTYYWCSCDNELSSGLHDPASQRETDS